MVVAMVVGTLGTLAPAMVMTFATITLGYMFARFHVIEASGARAMALFVSMLAYPGLVFYTLATLNFNIVIWPFFWSTFVSRVLIFLLPVAVELAWHGVTPDSVANAGIYGIFTSQSNDIPMGVPIMAAVFADSHPDWHLLLYIVMLTRVIINPFGFYMMQWGLFKNQEKRRKDRAALKRAAATAALAAAAASGEGGASASAAASAQLEELNNDEADQLQQEDPRAHLKMVGMILVRVFVNPFVLASILGIFANLAFGGKLPGVIDPFLKVLANCFTGLALFVLGSAMHGQLERLSDRRQLKVPLALFVAKSIAMPLISRFVAVAWGLGDISPDLVLFAFILGTLPSSENVPFFAFDYSVPSQHLIAPAMVLGTVLAAPVIFVAAQMVNITLSAELIDSILGGTLRVFAAFGIVCAVYFLVILWFNRRTDAVRDRLLIALITAQLVLNVSSEWCGSDLSGPGAAGLAVFRYGVVFASRMCTRFGMLAMAFNEVMHYAQSPARARKMLPFLIGGSVALALLVTVLAAVAGTRTPAPYRFADCYQRYGRAQWVILAVIDALSIVGLGYCMWRIGAARKISEEKEDQDCPAGPAGAAADSGGGGGGAGYRVVVDQDEETSLVAESEAGGPGGVSGDEHKDSSPAHAHTHGHALAHAQPGGSHHLAAPNEATGFYSPRRRGSHHHVHAHGADAAGLGQGQAQAHVRSRSHSGDVDASPTASASASASASPPLAPPAVYESEGEGCEDDAFGQVWVAPPVTAADEQHSWAFGMQVFLIVAFLWTLVHLCLSLWSASAPVSLEEGRIELLLLDSVLGGGQAIWTWLAFGLASHVKSPLTRVTNWIRMQSDNIVNWKGS